MRFLLVLMLAGCAAPVVRPAPPLDRAAMAARVREELRHAWSGYKRFAWGHDELNPLSQKPHDWYKGGPLLMTPVDALDTLLLAGLRDEANEARALIDQKLSFDVDSDVKAFEIAIRLLGGLLSSYELTHDPRLLQLADDLGARLLPIFESPTGMPYMFVNLRTGKVSGKESNPAEIGTLLLEFGTLAKHTGKRVYYDKPKRALVALFERRSSIGLVGDGINVETGEWTSTDSHIGGGIDSYYEYLYKAWLLFGDEDCHRMWLTHVEAVNKYVADETRTGLWYGVVDMRTGARREHLFGALEAFFPAVLAISGDTQRAERLESSAMRMWTTWSSEPDGFDYTNMRVVYPKYWLRPEILESAYYLHRLTHDERWLRAGARIFEDIVQHCRTQDGYTILRDVRTHEQGDSMPSYFLAETLKYAYLLAAPDDVLDLRAVVFNTEAHPFSAPRGAR